MKNKNRPLILFCLMCLFTAALSACTGNGSGAVDGSSATEAEPSVSAEAQSLPAGAQNDAGLPDGVTIEEIFYYSGAYVEDGSNAACESICAVRLYNASPVHYQYLRFSLETSGGAYTFAASTLFAGARMTVLCEENAPFDGGEVLSASLLTAAPFLETPTVHTDTLRITYSDGFLNVKNLTDGPLANVYVYYKDTDSYGYLGGITYRVSFGEIPAGETVQSGAANMRRATGRVVFVTYDG